MSQTMANVYRGFKTNKNPACTVSSIPTKYQRVVITNQEKKGFSSQTKRFPSQVCLNENPGPGSYCITSAEVNSPSFSKKGTSGFVPPNITIKHQRSSPGPNTYNLQSTFINKHDFNTGVSRVFRLPVAVQTDGPKHKTPAPNQYDVSCSCSARISSVVGTSSFLSKTTRSSFSPSKNVPSPGHYEVRDNITKHSSKAVLSPFKSKTQRIPSPVDNHVPGPGAYSPHQAPTSVKKTTPPRRFYLAIAAPPLIVPKDPPFPGPGQYDIGNLDRPPKRPVPSAAFASRTERLLTNSGADTRVGPGFYNPQLLSKQSFFYNDSRVWIPV
ncbi:O(6)-methylguanine-induced apoptosis 2 [Mugil cephalus]|uniref:O(6)-methylguanine-induced apoptosis 2 n=1 Tax=Mugil cephalus TaxID=48193 RepID=UPI001FB5DC11|nr:O(6)-methylguanine-induced apoptosis 2 [Mugil cephalus]